MVDVPGENNPSNSASRVRRIIIFGGGFAGAYCARKLEAAQRHIPNLEVVLIDRHNYFVFYPLLIEAGTGGVQARHAIVGIRSFLKRTKFIMGEMIGADTAARIVRYRLVDDPTERSLDYEHLVLALGSVTKQPDVAGLQEFGYQMKSLTDALSLHDRAVQLLEQANETNDPQARKAMLRFVVVGGNYTGVEVAGEFHAYLQEAARLYPNLSPSDVGMTIVDRDHRILTALDEDLSVWAAEHLRRRGIDLRLNNTLVKLAPDHVITGSGERIDAFTTVWAAGIAPNPMLQMLGMPRNKDGWMLCERDCRVEGHGNVWGIGDCAVNPDANGHAYAATAQHAVQEGRACADNVARVLRGQATLPCDVTNHGSLAAFGRFDAVAVVKGFRFTGFVAWFMWRTVYLFKMPGLMRKIRVAFDWTTDLILPRDYTELGVYRVLRQMRQKSAMDKGQSDDLKPAELK